MIAALMIALIWSVREWRTEAAKRIEVVERYAQSLREILATHADALRVMQATHAEALASVQASRVAEMARVTEASIALREAAERLAEPQSPRGRK